MARPETFQDAFYIIAHETSQEAESELHTRALRLKPCDGKARIADVLELMAWLKSRLWPGGSIWQWARSVYWQDHPQVDRAWLQLSAIAVSVLAHEEKIGPWYVLLQLGGLMFSKQRDYSPRNILDFGQVGVLVRANDKARRLENLLASGRTPENEAIADSWRDLANYAIIARMVRRGWFLLPLAEDTGGAVVVEARAEVPPLDEWFD